MTTQQEVSSPALASPPTFAVPPMVVGRYFDAAGVWRPLAFSSLELERARIAALTVLQSFHFRTGGNIMFTSMWDEVGQLLPVERAIMSYGMVVISADSSAFDAGRVESIARRFDLKGALGITSACLEGLARMGHDPARLFADMVVWARPGAYQTLSAIGTLNVHRCMELGPAFALECSARSGAHIDRFEWLVEEDEGEILLTSRLERSEPFQRLRTGQRGRVMRGVCACGNADPRVILD